jgi:hypothetical protein
MKVSSYNNNSFCMLVSKLLILFILFVSYSHAVAINKQEKTAESVAVKQTTTDKLAHIQDVASIAYTSLKPFSKNESKMECVLKAENMIGKLADITKDAVKAQIVYDQDPDSMAGQEAEKNIKDANFAATELKKIIMSSTQKCAKDISSMRAYIAAKEQAEIERLERVAREMAKKKFNATMFPNPTKREERQKAFMKAKELKTKARNFAKNIGANSEMPLDIVARNRMARMEETYKVDAKHAEEFAKGETSAEEFGKWKEKLKTLKLRAEKSRLKAVEEENKKFKLKSEASDIIAKHLKDMRAAYSKGCV